MTAALFKVRKKLEQLSLTDLGRRLNPVAEDFLAFHGGDATAAKLSLYLMPLDARLKTMLCLAVETVIHRRQRRTNREIDGLRILRGRW